MAGLIDNGSQIAVFVLQSVSTPSRINPLSMPSEHGEQQTIRSICSDIWLASTLTCVIKHERGVKTPQPSTLAILCQGHGTNKEKANVEQ